jgi:3-keto-disaccharide hydrolase/VCBS repeat protein
MMKNLKYLLIVIVIWTAFASTSPAGETIFVPVKIDGPVHDPANHSYWFGPFCECASVLDVDGDGDLDIASGRNWYEAPHWIKHADFRDGAATNGPETDDNSEFAMDVNFDGKMDIVSSGWMFMKGAFWYENPGKKGVVWKSTRIHMALNMEGVIHGDIDGDGDDDILCNHWSLVPGQGMTWLEHINRAPWFIEHVVGTQGDVHGNGLGDINGDGRMDIVTPEGWYEQPPRAKDKPWKFHADYKFEPAKSRGGGASHPILVYDVNEDGLNDILIGSSHAYGLAWLEQKINNGKRSFQTHWIDTEYSQFHTIAMDDLNGDGKPDLVTGKRLFAHHGSDIGAFEPLYAFWYDIQKGNFERHTLSFNHLPHYPDENSHNPPPNTVVSVGMKLNIADMDKDGRNDVIIAGKGGLYVFYNKGEPPTPRRAHKLPAHESYPSWRDWPGYKIHFNSKDFTGWKVPQGDNGHWKVVDGVIDYDAMSEAKGDKNLWTEESFEDFALHVEWRLKETSGLYPMPTILPDGSYKKDADGKVIIVPTPNADSGILLRGTGRGQVNIWCWACGSGELWSVRNDQKLTPEQRAAAVPKVKADKPVGQWNSMDITVAGDRVSVMLNGIPVIENAQVPGIPESGPIGFQHHGGIDKNTGKHGSASSLIQFRNIWIKKLKKQNPKPTAQKKANPYSAVPQVDADGFSTLFNGKDLNGWLTGPDNAWVVENGVITLKRNFDGREHNADYLWAKNKYDDFVLELECKIPERANSGIFLRTSDLKDPVYTGLEVQVANSYGRNQLSSKGTAGAIYDCLAPTKNAIKKPGEWNQYRILCEDNLVKIWLNGESVINMDLNRWTKPNENPEPQGSKNKFPRPLKNFARQGYIGLQDHGRPVWYRNIRIKPL